MKNMTSDRKRSLILSTLLCLIPVIAGVILYAKLPAEIVTHWDAQGEPNGWSSKFLGAIVYPGILALVNISVPFLMQIDPKYENMNDKLKSLIQWIIPFVSMFCAATTLAAAMGKEVHIKTLGPLFMGVLFVLIGNYLPKTGQSYTLGIKLPWTLHSEENWNRTHRFGGFVWVIGGVLVIISMFFPASGILIGITTAVMVLLPAVYSYMLYRKGI